LRILLPAVSPLFAYTTLFRSVVAILRAGPSWEDATWTALTLAALLLGAGTLLARAFGDAAAGAVLAALAMVPAACGGALALGGRSEEHTSELQSRENLVCRLL